jgi:ribonuclease III
LDFIEMQFEKLQKRIGYVFGDRKILLQALTHTSYGHEYFPNQAVATRDNERLEFLGDAVLDLIISDLLLESYPDSHEGELTRMRAALVNEKTLAKLSLAIGVDECVRLGKGEERTGGKNKASILSSTFEAIVAALYLDGGFQGVYPVVRHLFAPFLETKQDSSFFYDHKTQLQELVQARWKITPTYDLVRTHGPEHSKIFEVEVRMGEERLARAMGASKKEAEQKAAKAAIASFSS